MKENDLLAPHRPVQRDARAHDGTIVTERVDEVWGTDMTQTFTTAQGRAYVFIAVDHYSGEFRRHPCLLQRKPLGGARADPPGVTRHFGAIEPDVAAGLKLRHDHGSNYMAVDFQNEVCFFGITSSPSFVRQPEGNGVAERPYEP